MGTVANSSFSKVSLSDPFFDSLKEGYAEFADWFAKKASLHEPCIVVTNDDGSVSGFLYLKVEDGSVEDVVPPLPPALRVKIGTLKIDAHGTRLGERFLKKAFDYAVAKHATEIYVTVFDKHQKLIDLFENYGFEKIANKSTINGVEHVLLKSLASVGAGGDGCYPLLDSKNAGWMLSIYPTWHTRLFPDSILKTEDVDLIEDVSHTNSIQKVYLASMTGMERMQPGDNLVIYRTSDNLGPAEYRSVATSVCRLKEYRNIHSFSTMEEFIKYCEPYSVFERHELETFFKTKKFQHVIRFTYNFPFKKRITRHDLINSFGVDRNAYAGFMALDQAQVRAICNAGGVGGHHFVD